MKYNYLTCCLELSGDIRWCDVDEIPFVDIERSLILTLNIDWIQSFNNATYSCGAFYLAINNLSRSERFKKGIDILLGLTPGLKGVSTSDINHYLKHLVHEFKELYMDNTIKTHQCPNALLVISDLISQNGFFVLGFLEASRSLSMTIRGNEPLPPSALPLKTRPLSFMPKHEYDCLVGYYQAAYKNSRISSCKDIIDDSPFVNDWIETVKSVDLLGQTYKGCIGTNGRGSYVQAYFTERTGSEHAYVGEIQYLFVHNFKPTVSSLTYRHPQSSQHVFAFVKWFKTTSDKTRELEGVELLQDEFYKADFQSILPVHRILMTVAIVDYKTIRNVSKKLAAPLPKRNYY
ncbi:hypothetical protein PHYBLDRAFT_147911 [Phycomyces blakesleeanus NRRL 1555(-)]|uniref:Uncharacterized protein n=1 Tax=Phycomyces blakesleeanus (strain ATCC 8743b / DSM 1359 / FGSC 10004 / NBRC 33097 / NRRL 1555) TaxID=763407 RepID=A0A167LZJ1_PHYB8|nr:hypothetical protein PHYBLDRAFT_147911 [Phycomyces blakesleeanus NRRL 1555(-)]OAD71417.1 hypothetical protein PHYBLDRAFT_147911 [Phycomyces blakesleeanus NRRL 1555(-)]|eukprot:XP_018289457.1 hypothetical protein PHYBLDRAFT_147911 [Phycomyces blakesleeanus NRRL 1555(-)]